MLYFRAVYDLAAIVKLVSDKIGPADRIQVLTLLRGIQDYLQRADVLASTRVVYDEPLVVIRNLVISVEETNYAQFDNSILCRKKEVNTPRSVNQSTPIQSYRKPPVFRGAAIKRAAPSSPNCSGNDEQDYYNDAGSDRSDDNDDRYVETQSNVVEDDVVYEVQEDWQPIDMLERALTTIAQESSKAKYTVDVSDFTVEKSPPKKSKPKHKKWRPSTNNIINKYLPIGEKFINPAPRVRGTDGVKKWPTNARWVCVYCRQIFRNTHNYKNHLKCVHKNEGSCSCRYCKKEFVNHELLHYHLCPLKNKCNICYKQFMKPSTLRKHMGVHIKSTVVMITCRICAEDSAQPVRHFNSMRECASHVYDDHEIIILCDSCLSEMDPSDTTATDPTRLYCQWCVVKVGDGVIPAILPGNPNQDINISKQDIDIYKRNRRRTKPIQRPVQSEKEKLRKITPTEIIEVTEESVHCKVCNLTCLTAKMYTFHITSDRHIKLTSQLTGKELPKFPCLECGKVFITDKTLQAHIRKNHKNASDEVLKCTICDRALMTSSGLKSHMRSHMNLRNYICEDCGKGFNNSNDLKNHREWKHVDGFPEACRQCDKAFKHRRALKHHIQVVHDRLVYKCPECKLQFSKSSGLKAHIEQVHKSDWTMPSDYLQKSDRPYQEPKSRRSQVLYDSSSDTTDDDIVPCSDSEEEGKKAAAPSKPKSSSAPDIESSSFCKPLTEESTSRVITTRLRTKSLKVKVDND